MKRLNQIPILYHFTDRRNLPLIVEKNGLYSFAQLKKMSVKIPAPGGNDWSQEADQYRGMDKYVHLCFRSSHPMEYRAREAKRIEDSIFLQIHPSVLHVDGVKFTAEVSNKSGVQVYDIKDAASMIDYQVLYTRTDWSDPEIKQRLQQVEKYELLVPDHIPLSLIRNIPNG